MLGWGGFRLLSWACGFRLQAQVQPRHETRPVRCGRRIDARARRERAADRRKIGESTRALRAAAEVRLHSDACGIVELVVEVQLDVG
jgi:hypothetical protein